MTPAPSSEVPKPHPPSSRTLPPGGVIPWVRRVNDRWLVHQGLNTSAGLYMDYLAEHDPARLETSCHTAWKMAGTGEPSEDPKPLFYGGLFSLCRPEEEARFLASHLFTLLTNPHRPLEAFEALVTQHAVTPAAREKALQLRQRIAQVAKEPATT